MHLCCRATNQRDASAYLMAGSGALVLRSSCTLSDYCEIIDVTGRATRLKTRAALADVPIPHSLDRNTLATDEQSGRHASLPAAHSDGGISATQLYEYT